MKTNLVACGVILAGVCASHAAERIWNGANNANWMDTDVWTTNGVAATAPENTDTVTINNGTTVNLNSPALDDTNRFAMVQLNGTQRGTLVVGPGAYLPTVLLNVAQNGTSPTTPGRVVVDGGFVNATGIQLFGTDNVNNPGYLEIINSGNYTSTAAFRLYNGSVLVSNSTFSTTFTSYLHGSSATSTFEIVDSTVNLTAMAIGRDVQNASGKVCRNILRMRSGSLNLSGTIEVGHTGNSTASITGVVEQTGGAVTIGGGGMISMPVNTYATGFFNLSGGRLSLLNGGDSMRLGGRDAAGKGFFTMTDGVLTNKGTMYLGTATGGYGTFEQSGGNSFFEKTILVGASTNATGNLNLLGGTLNLSAANANINVGNFSNATGRCLVSGGLLNAAGRTLYLGSVPFGNGSLIQSGGIVSNAATVIGNAYASSGTLLISNGLFNVAGSMNVGNVSNATSRCEVDGGLLNLSGTVWLGSGTMGSGTFVQNNGIVSNNTTVIGSAYASSGTLIVSNGLFITASGLNVGNMSNATGRCEVDGGLLYVNGVITLGVASNSVGAFVMNGGTVSNTGFTVGNILSTTGTVEIAGGEAYSANEFLIGHGVKFFGAVGKFSMSGGKLLVANRWIVGSFGSGYATVSGGEIEALRNGSTTECMEVGRDSGTFGRLEMTGGALKGTNELVIARDAGSTGLVYVAGGDLYFNTVRRGGGLSALNLAGGTLHPYNRDTAFAFSATLTNDIGYGATGTRFGLSPVDKDGAERAVTATCTFAGNGGLAKRGAGTVTLGGALTYKGDTVVEAGTLALSNGVASLASGVIEVRSGATLDVSVNRASAFVITTNQTLIGGGTVTGAVRLAGGAVISGGTAGAPAVLTINGDLTLDAGSTLLFNMLGGVYGGVHVTGNLTLPATANLTVNGLPTSDAEGRAMLSWDGNLIMPAATRWTVEGEKSPLAVFRLDTKTLTLSYLHGTLMLVE